MFRPTTKLESAHSSDIWFASWNGDHILTTSLDGTAKLWDCSEEKLKLVNTTPNQKLGITSAHLLSDYTQLITCCQDSIIRFYDVSTDFNQLSDIGNIDPGIMEAWTICVSPDDQLIASGSSKGISANLAKSLASSSFVLEMPDGSSQLTRTNPPLVPERVKLVKKSEITLTPFCFILTIARQLAKEAAVAASKATFSLTDHST